MAEPNKEYWRDEQVADYERKQRLLAPRKDELLNSIVEFIPFNPDAEIRVIDVGAGQGALSERILIRFSAAHATLLDASEQMLSVAEKRLSRYGPRFSIEIGDFNSPEWHHLLETPVDAVVSSIALHYLRTERRAPFLESVYQVLDTPGCFINGDSFNARDPFVQDRVAEDMIAYTQSQLLETEGRDVPMEKLREMRRTETARAGVNRLFLDEQVGALEQSGFSNVEVVWRYLMLAVVAAYKRQPVS